MTTGEDRRRFTDANRDAWDEAASIHRERNQARHLEGFARPGHSTLGAHTVARLTEIGVRGKRVAQLCCNNGIDLLSVKNMGAARCVGFDASAPFIAQARELAAAAGHQDVEFVVTDHYDIPARTDEPFDLVVSTIGVLGWMPDLDGFFEVAAGLVVPGGHLFIEEIHPALIMYEPGDDGAPSYLANSYFREEPWVETDGLDYYGGTRYEAKPTYAFPHTLAKIVMAAIGAGLTLRHFAELDYDISLFCADLEHVDTKPPLGMTMVWQR